MTTESNTLKGQVYDLTEGDLGVSFRVRGRKAIFDVSKHFNGALPVDGDTVQISYTPKAGRSGFYWANNIEVLMEDGGEDQLGPPKERPPLRRGLKPEAAPAQEPPDEPAPIRLERLSLKDRHIGRQTCLKAAVELVTSFGHYPEAGAEYDLGQLQAQVLDLAIVLEAWVNEE